MNQTSAREFQVEARSTDIFGRVLCSARQQHFVIDGPVQNGCPGEALTPPEAFLAGVASCGVELIQVLAKEQGLPLAGAQVSISAILDRSQQPRQDLTVFNSLRLGIGLRGITAEQGTELAAAFQKR